MTNPLKLPAIIAIAAAALVIMAVVGYKTISAPSSPERTDAAHREVVAAMAAARASSHKGEAPTYPHP